MMLRKANEDNDFKFVDGQDFGHVFRHLTVKSLKAASQRHMSTSRAKSRSELYKLISEAPTQVQENIRKDVTESLQTGGQKHCRKSTSTETTQIATPESVTVGVHCESSSVSTGIQHLGQLEHSLCENPFMKAPSRETVDSAIEGFIDRTSKSALATGVCAACARESNRTELTLYPLDQTPSPGRLVPLVPHAAHDIYEGMLLHPTGFVNENTINICMECVRALLHDKTPPLALANGMWVGATPHELAYLTIPERLLIAKYFPSAYIIKLYPKKKGARHWDRRQMYSGLKGNVSTYQLDQSQISSMIDGTVMPQRPRLLAATIGITFVGPRNLPDKCLPDIFKVRRARVHRALEWLKENNPLFSNITISASRLAELPENDVPYELQATAKHSTDVDKLHAEHEGYVPPQEEHEDECNEGKY